VRFNNNLNGFLKSNNIIVKQSRKTDCINYKRIFFDSFKNNFITFTGRHILVENLIHELNNNIFFEKNTNILINHYDILANESALAIARLTSEFISEKLNDFNEHETNITFHNPLYSVKNFITHIEHKIYRFFKYLIIILIIFTILIILIYIITKILKLKKRTKNDNIKIEGIIVGEEIINNKQNDQENIKLFEINLH